VTEDEAVRLAAAPVAARGIRAVYRLAGLLVARYGDERAHDMLNATLAEVNARGLEGAAAVRFLEGKKEQFEGGL